MSEAVGIVTGGGGVFLLGVLTWWSKMKIDKRSGDMSITEQQRLGFESILKPLREEVKELRHEVSGLRAEVSKERDLRERILAYARQLYWAWNRQFPNDPPPAAAESIRTYFE